MKVIGWIFIFLILSISLLGLTFAQNQNVDCEQCGMTVDPIGQKRFNITDSTGNTHIVCCPVCALKLLNTYESLTITTFCDYAGPENPISIIATEHGDNVEVNPPTALIIIGGGGSKKRLTENPAAADNLLLNNGKSTWLSPLSNDTVAKNATRMGITQAVIKYSGLTLDSTECEACGMTVTADSQTRYNIVDGDNQKHYVECYMCALSLIEKYESLRIETTCDWYGPGYIVTVDSSTYGQNVVVSPTTAIFLRGGNCVTARVAYNQTAADNLLAHGYSSFTSTEQQYALPVNTDIKLISEAITAWYSQPSDNTTSTNLLLILAVATGVIVIAAAIIAFKKLKHT